MDANWAKFVRNYLSEALVPSFVDGELQHLTIERENQSWKFFLIVKTALPTSAYQEFSRQILQKFSFLQSAEVFPQLRDPVQGLLAVFTERRTELFAWIQQKHPLQHENLQELEWHFSPNQRITLSGCSEAGYQELLSNGICEKISEWFWREYRLKVSTVTSCQRIAENEESRVFVRQDEKVETLPEIMPDDGTGRRTSPYTNGNTRRNTARSLKERETKKLEQGLTPIHDLAESSRSVVIEGEIFLKEASPLKDGRIAMSYYVSDQQDSVVVKTFIRDSAEDVLHEKQWLRIQGTVRYDSYARDIVLFMEQYALAERPKREDHCEFKRVELHAHTNMSAMDALTDAKEMVKLAAEWGHPAIAITDHGCIQSFPAAFTAAQDMTKKGKPIRILFGVEGYLVEENYRDRAWHIIILAKNRVGLKNMYELISKSYIDYFYRKPKIPRAELMKYREGLILGSACQAGELFQAVLNNEPEEKIEQIVNFYDYLEVQPLCNNLFLVNNGRLQDEKELEQLTWKIINLGKKYHKPVAATGDVHFLEPEHEIFRSIVQAGQGYKDSEEPAPLYLRTTDEMREEFSFLQDEETVRWIVQECPQQIMSWIEELRPIPDGFYPPVIDTAQQEILDLSWGKAREMYGEPLPEIVEQRINHELKAIIGHDFSVLYLVAHKLVKKSNDDGFIVGSRGSVGSSFIAYLTGITEVNSLPPHYLCKECHYFEQPEVSSDVVGVDLPDKNCPHCGTPLQRLGFDIPFETFLGFNGDKVPDIDLNFSGDYQPRAHHYVEEIFGAKNVFRAGTIATIAEKTAFGFAKKYCEEKGIVMRNAEMRRLALGVQGVRRTTGQHPGGMVVVPANHEITEFTPVQHPADKKESGVITTHFEYHSMEAQLVKLDILGHDDPTMVRFLEQLTGIRVKDLPLNDPDTMSLFSSTQALGVTPEDIESNVGTYAVPEFGTGFVRQMLEATKPDRFSQLVRISGLSHGEQVWNDNAEVLIREGTATLNEAICTRDDIMTYLISMKLPNKQAFDIMEHVRKGKGLTAEEIQIMREHEVPEWYIDSCTKIHYMFPKAHAVAYVTMACRLAWFKVHQPLAFYASFFSIRGEEFDIESALGGLKTIKAHIKKIDGMGYEATAKDKKQKTVMEVAMEMCARGFRFYPIDLYESEAAYFRVKEDGLLIPFGALPGVGGAAAKAIADSRGQEPFLSVEDFQNRSGANKTSMDMLRQFGCFDGMPESNQMSLF